MEGIPEEDLAAHEQGKVGAVGDRDGGLTLVSPCITVSSLIEGKIYVPQPPLKYIVTRQL